MKRKQFPLSEATVAKKLRYGHIRGSHHAKWERTYSDGLCKVPILRLRTVS